MLFAVVRPCCLLWVNQLLRRRHMLCRRPGAPVHAAVAAAACATHTTPLGVRTHLHGNSTHHLITNMRL